MSWYNEAATSGRISWSRWGDRGCVSCLWTFADMFRVILSGLGNAWLRHTSAAAHYWHIMSFAEKRCVRKSFSVHPNVITVERGYERCRQQRLRWSSQDIWHHIWTLPPLDTESPTRVRRTQEISVYHRKHLDTGTSLWEHRNIKNRSMKQEKQWFKRSGEA